MAARQRADRSNTRGRAPNARIARSTSPLGFARRGCRLDQRLQRRFDAIMNTSRSSKPPRGPAAKAARGKATAPARGGTKMKAYASFDLYAADRPPAHRRLIARLRAFVRRTAPWLQESVKWGNGCWLAGKVPIAYVYSAPDHLQFGFFRGAALMDPLGRLEGKGQYVRHVKLRRPADLDEHAVAALLRQAIA
jgi:hypothetical protein